MSNSKLNFIQSLTEQQQKADQLELSLQQLSLKLENFVKIIEQSEKPIINSTTLLHKVQQTTIALESHLSSILIQIENLSPQALKETTASYKAQIDVLTTQLASIDIAEISKVKLSIDSFSISIQALQNHINSQLQSISIDKPSLQKNIQSQVNQAIANQSEQIESDIQILITEKLSTQRATYLLYGMMAFGVLILLMSFLLSYQASSNLKTIKAQREVIQQNSQTITSQINYLNSLRK